jgi:soluble lytic murein transglycosylase-like protein
MSYRGALGLIQMMPFLMKRYNPGQREDYPGNPYLPQDNVSAGARHINLYLSLVKKVGADDDIDLLAKALAGYNGGREDILQQNSWEAVVKGESKIMFKGKLKKAVMGDESIAYAIRIKEKLGLPLRDYEKDWLKKHPKR